MGSQLPVPAYPLGCSCPCISSAAGHAYYLRKLSAQQAHLPSPAGVISNSPHPYAEITQVRRTGQRWEESSQLSATGSLQQQQAAG